MNTKLVFAALFASSSFVALQGCAAVASEDPSDAPGADETAASQDELTTAATKLVGGFHLANSSGRFPSFDGIAFKQNGEFLADVDTGIRCFRAPCPSNVRLTGKFTATRTFVTLSPTTGSAESSFYGKFRYSLADGKLSLTRDGATWRNWSNDLDSKQGSYCVEAADCGGQNLIVPACVGHFTCGEQRSCGFACGVIPVESVWPADKTMLVAQNMGGGFAPPPPPGSTCTVGAGKFSLSIQSRELAWETCAFDNTSGTLQTVKGNRTITSAELAKVDRAMNGVTVSKREICGADKPFLTLKVTSASQGEKVYADSFYSCRGGDETFVDNIDGAFSALRDLAH